MERINACVLDYVTEHPNADYGHIKARFGSPEQITTAYVIEKEPGELLKELKVKKRILGVILGAAVIAVTLWVGYVMACYCEVKDNANGCLVIGEAVIVEQAVNKGGK